MLLLRSPLLLFLAAATTALQIHPRQSSQIYKDLTNINSAIISLTTAVKTWGGTDLLSALPINTAASDVKSKIDAAAASTPNQPAISDTEANAILSFIDQSLKPNVKAAADAVKAKAGNFKTVKADGIVKTTLSGLYESTSKYGTALIAKAPSGSKTKAQMELSTIEGYIADAQKAFG